MTRVLVAGESWMSVSTHYKGFDAFTTTTYHTGFEPLRDVLVADGIEVDHLPAHDVPKLFPGTFEELAAYDVVVLSDIGANSILLHPDTWLHSRKSANRLDLLASWVEQGGGLAMAGGYLSFQGIEAKAAFRGTPVERVLPARISPYDDRVEAPQGLPGVVVDPAHPIVDGLPSDWPDLLGYNRFEVPEDARLLATVGADPLLAVRQAGAGRTLAWASDIAPHWCPEEFVTWDGYRTLFTRAVRWLAKEI
ncbi:glutamine amidotransferase [Streptosporangium amethystogenes]|uniref:glutamine amidotransferase n=1 Tax=Streptosporangium amethystogenes TaxID=2002 RepID=UPI0004C9208A|nr:glutamine amidotransferase [Streptosporangium amethystogenes]